jgi:uncharacterized DUF497 family protein
MPFDWDAVKNSANLAKHGIDFQDAVRIFERPTLERVDDRQDYGEIRVIAFGVVDDREVVVIYTARGEVRRIISARRAHSSERKTYREAYPKRP